jgi:hypothetical protein
MAIKNETHDYHNDENDKNDVESKGQKNRTALPPSPPSIQLSMEGILPLEETVLGSYVIL